MHRPSPPAAAAPLLSISGLTIGAGMDAIVDGVGFDADAGETVCLVGESGSGKSLTCLSILGLLPPPLVSAGRFAFQGADVSRLQARAALRGMRVGMVFQNPLGSLNPVRSIGSQLVEVIAAHRGLAGRRALTLARRMLEEVGVPSAAQVLAKYPHELSGGLNQRVAIALALAPAPLLLVADEPTTALDVTVQSQILGLLRRLQGERGMGLLLVTHDLGVVAETADRVVVLYAGRVVETAPVGALFDRPRHPYTAALIGALPRLGDRRRQLAAIPGGVPAAGDRPAACVFAPRCARARDRCRRQRPPLQSAGVKAAVACHFPL